MNNHETLREYFLRARNDPTVRAHLLENARYSRSVFGWIVFASGVLAFWQSGYQLWREGVWISWSSIFYTFCFVVNLLIYDKFGDRVAMFAAMDDVPNQSPELQLASTFGKGSKKP